MKVGQHKVYIHTDLYHAGITEDGEPFHAEQYCLVLETAQGKRLAHYKSFKGCVHHEDHETGCIGFEDIRKEAYASAQALLNRVLSVGYISINYWTEVDPVYGSPRFQELNSWGVI